MIPRLNRRLELQVPVRVADGAGGIVQSWAARGTHWAEITPRTARPMEKGAAGIYRQGLKITLRAVPHGSPGRPRPGHRFAEGARIYAVEGVAESDPDGRHLVCFAVEEVAG
ncbi:head-tail adaptor protein [Pseudooceanicola aestuarii]|uniref:head-tail adaptor protein n=1 Tax=Pseudooceanicola aestuarii TaxID=2697319 RepID=UPI0013D593A2|nr:head-tail adaptor protein [Pseudooceanicola aestuarii]